MGSKIFFAICIILCSCKSGRKANDITRAVYHWKTVYKPTNFETATLEKLTVKKLYLRYFDVEWNEARREATPLATLLLKKSPAAFNIVPTVFITNESIFKSAEADIPALAQKVYRLLFSINNGYHLPVPREIQIDCDWTESTRDKYFILLNSLKQQDTAQLYSATIRLHQIKFRSKTGVPPVSRGMLMCYNMGNLTDESSNNSILDIKELKKYLGPDNNYPLPLDVALPVFEWVVIFRKGKYFGLLREFPSELVGNEDVAVQDNRFTVQKAMNVNGYELLPGDVLRYETSEAEVVAKAGTFLKNYISAASLTISLYHLDSLTLSKYSTNELENIYNSLR